jgi:D-glycero-D-manno-heptose 1,7-bisphosphate phosphatase
MLRTAAADLAIDLSRSWLVGDRWVDIAAGQAAGVRTVLVERTSSWQPTSAGSPPDDLRPTAVVATIDEAVDYILAARPMFTSGRVEKEVPWERTSTD